MSPADRHRRVAEDFGRQVEATVDWDAPTPVPEWTARDVVGHLTEWFPGFLAAGTGIIDAATGPSSADGPAAAWRRQADWVQRLLDDPATAGRTFEHPMIPVCPVTEAIDRFYTTDVMMHTWDLARAGGRNDGLDPDECAALLTTMEPLDEMLRQSGQYGPRQPVAADADGTARLMAFIGRDPTWPRPR